MSNQKNTNITLFMSEIIAGKFACLASQLPGMKVQYLNGLQYVDCGIRSDTFNTVFGTPALPEEVELITHYCFIPH